MSQRPRAPRWHRFRLEFLTQCPSYLQQPFLAPGSFSLDTLMVSACVPAVVPPWAARLDSTLRAQQAQPHVQPPFRCDRRPPH
jgi:hypothetical protein